MFFNPWFESIAVAQKRAKRRLPASVYGALIAGAEAGVTVDDNTSAFDELGLRPVTAGQSPTRDMATEVMGQPISMPVLISPTGVQAVHPDGEVAVSVRSWLPAIPSYGLRLDLRFYITRPNRAEYRSGFSTKD